MLEYLRLRNVGPAAELDVDLAPRLNVITGDNGLGKSFLLDIAWWSLTRTWAGQPARPTAAQAGEASIAFSFEGERARLEYESAFDRGRQAWLGRRGRPANPGLVLYAQVDGSFSVWDPARNYWRTGPDGDVQDRPPAYLFDPRQVWDGLERDGKPLSNGLLRDWASWQRENGAAFDLLTRALRAMSPSTSEPLVPGVLTRISLDDSRDMPTLRMPYGQDVPIVHASAGMRRVVALTYLLVWAWREHLQASELLGKTPTRQVIFLVDEVEGHLHPRWQRLVMKSLLEVVGELMTSGEAQVQVVAATHSPLVLASLEPLFDPALDAWFDLDYEPGSEPPRVVITRRHWTRHGDANRWLTSEAFGLGSARSVEAEALLEEASHALSEESFDRGKAIDLDGRLRTVLGDTDPFWMRWRFVGEKRGWLAAGAEKREGIQGRGESA